MVRVICSILSLSCGRLVVLLIISLEMAGMASGQGLLDQPYIPSAVGPSAALLPAFRASTNLVLVPVTVLDSGGRPADGLKAENFSLTDNQRPQTIKYFSQEDTPISLTIVLDSSGSMATKLSDARTAALELLKDANQDDEFSLIVFGNEPRGAARFSDSVDDIGRIVSSTQPDGFTSLWDAIHLALEQQKNSRYERRAIVVISDGGDNHSRYSEDKIKSLLEEADVQVYAIALADAFVRTQEERLGPLRLDEITSVTGGRAIPVHELADIRQAARNISSELRSKYLIGYYPTDRLTDGKWRKVKVRLTGVPGNHHLHLNARSGYYGPTG